MGTSLQCLPPPSGVLTFTRCLTQGSDELRTMDLITRQRTHIGSYPAFFPPSSSPFHYKYSIRITGRCFSSHTCGPFLSQAGRQRPDLGDWVTSDSLKLTCGAGIIGVPASGPEA